MTARETKLQNAYESTLISALSASSGDVTVSVAASPAGINDFSSGSGFYLVIDPDSDSTREYVYVSVKSGVNFTVTRNIDNFGGGLNAHSIGAKVRFVAMAEMFNDVHDRIDTIINEDGTAVNTSLSASGFSEKYFFYGFFPSKLKDIQNDLKSLSNLNSCIIFFISSKNNFLVLSVQLFPTRTKKNGL